MISIFRESMVFLLFTNFTADDDEHGDVPGVQWMCSGDSKTEKRCNRREALLYGCTGSHRKSVPLCPQETTDTLVSG